MPNYLVHARNAKYYLLETAGTFNPQCGFLDRLQSYRTFCLSLETLAHCALLAEANPARFSLNLMRAAVNWKALLEHVSGHEPGHRVPASLSVPLQGAICCGPLSFACELAARSARQITSPEYDDEFLASFFVQEYLRGRFERGNEVADLEDICAQIDAYLGEETSRVDTFRALVRRQEARFWSSFQEWNELAAQDMDARVDAPGAPAWLDVGRYVWMEGLAILKLAALAGFQAPPRVFRMVPRLALVAPATLPGNAALLLGQPIRENEI